MAAQVTAPRKASAHSGLSGKWKRWRCRRPDISIATTPAQATSPTIQLQFAPIEPSGPPPSRRKVASIGATVCPLVTHQAAPRQISSPPSVTMKEGIDR